MFGLHKRIEILVSKIELQACTDVDVSRAMISVVGCTGAIGSVLDPVEL